MKKVYDPFGVPETQFEEHVIYEKTLPKEVRNFVFERDKFMCRSCNDNRGISPHHITFRSAGGTHDPENLVTLCYNCHERVHRGLLIVGVVNGHYFFGGKKRWQ